VDKAPAEHLGRAHLNIADRRGDRRVIGQQSVARWVHGPTLAAHTTTKRLVRGFSSTTVAAGPAATFDRRGGRSSADNRGLLPGLLALRDPSGPSPQVGGRFESSQVRRGCGHERDS
jgi:hypothetical protein